jgi:hypothetical protein
LAKVIPFVIETRNLGNRLRRSILSLRSEGHSSFRRKTLVRRNRPVGEKPPPPLTLPDHGLDRIEQMPSRSVGIPKFARCLQVSQAIWKEFSIKLGSVSFMKSNRREIRAVPFSIGLEEFVRSKPAEMMPDIPRQPRTWTLAMAYQPKLF